MSTRLGLAILPLSLAALSIGQVTSSSDPHPHSTRADGSIYCVVVQDILHPGQPPYEFCVVKPI